MNLPFSFLLQAFILFKPISNRLTYCPKSNRSSYERSKAMPTKQPCLHATKSWLQLFSA